MENSVDETKAGDILVVAADWNACTGLAIESTRHFLGHFALDNHCSNVELLRNSLLPVEA